MLGRLQAGIEMCIAPSLDTTTPCFASKQLSAMCSLYTVVCCCCHVHRTMQRIDTVLDYRTQTACAHIDQKAVFCICASLIQLVRRLYLCLIWLMSLIKRLYLWLIWLIKRLYLCLSVWSNWSEGCICAWSDWSDLCVICLIRQLYLLQ